MPPRTGEANAAPRMAAYAVGVVAIVAPQLLGGATAATELSILCLGFAASLGAGLAVWGGRQNLGETPIAAAGMAIAAAWTLIQALPLPCAWIASAFPARMEIIDQIVQLGAIQERVCTLSTAPGSTRAALALALTLLELVVVSTALARAGQRPILLMAIALSSVAMAVVALGHTVVAAEHVFGIYAPREVRPGLLLAPLLNANHLAGHLALGFPLCLSFGLSHERLDVRIAWLTGAFLVLVCTMFTLSRGGAGAVALGGGGYVIAQLVRRRSRELSLQAKVAGAALVLGGGLAAFLGASLTAAAFEAEGASLDKLMIAGRLLRIVRDHPWLGIGRGALVDVAPTVFAGNVSLPFAENLPVQWSVEWGLVATLLIAALVATSLIRSRPRRRTELALLMGLLALVAQNLVDFSLEVAGVASVAAIGLGTLLSRERPHRLVHLPPLRLSIAAAVPAAAAGVLCAAPVLSYDARHEVRAELGELLETAPETFDRRLTRALRNYPLDPALAVYASAEAVRQRRPTAPKWLNLAMQLAPTWCDPHVQAAFYFEQIGALSQAAVELGQAAAIDLQRWNYAACDFLQRHPQAKLAYTMTSMGAHRKQSLAEVLACFPGNPTEAERLAELIVEDEPDFTPAMLQLALFAARRDEAEPAQTWLQTAMRISPRDPAVWATKLWVLHELGSSTQAAEAFRHAPAEIRKQRVYLVAAADIAAATKNLPWLEAVLPDLISRYGSTVALRANLEAHASRLYSIAGDPMRALTSAQAAYEALGTPELAELAHAAALQAGIPGVALRMASELCQVAHRNRWYCSNPTRPAP